MSNDPPSTRPGQARGHSGAGAYVRFAGMILTGTAVMLAFTYLNSYRADHIYWSETRFYMALLMGAAMAVIMLSFMLHMLKDKRANLAIYGGSVLVFAVALWLVRSQTTVQDVSYMKAMIPHHSIAILTSERAEISDPRVRELADEIIESQRREIAEMKQLIADLSGKETPGRSGSVAAKTRTESTLRGAASASGSKRSHASTEDLPEVPPPDASAAQVPEGFEVDVVMKGLNFPTSIELDDAGNLYVAESGYTYGGGAPPPRILRIEPSGQTTVAASGASLRGPVNDVLWHAGHLYVSHRGRISKLEEGGLRDLVTGLPSDGDHHNNQLSAGPDGKLYFGQGTATNSAVVGPDNHEMGWLQEHPDFHDVPAESIRLADRRFESKDPFGSKRSNIVTTSAFHAFGQGAGEDRSVPGSVKASGAILRMDQDGGNLEVYAWGLRNPYGVCWSPDGKLYATENGFDVRGSRPVANDEEDIYVIEEGGWYGWPDFAMGLPVTNPRFAPPDGKAPAFVLAEHPPVKAPWMNFPKHSAITKLDFAPAEAFGKGNLFVAFFGHLTPMTGKPPKEHGGHRVVRIDPRTREVVEFFSGKHASQGGGGGEEEGHHGSTDESAGGGHDESVTPGPRRLVDVCFDGAGSALYLADFGAVVVKDGPHAIPGTGVIWRVVPAGERIEGPPAGLEAP